MSIPSSNPSGGVNPGDSWRTPTPVFDPAAALKRCFGKAEMVQEMVACFLSEADPLILQMHVALQQRDLVELGRLGHRMKGIVAYLAAEPARRAALGVEHFLRNPGTVSEAEQAVSKLEQQCVILRVALATHLPSG